MYRRSSYQDWEPRGRSRGTPDAYTHARSGRSRSRSKHRIGGLLAGVGIAALLAKRVAGCLDQRGGRRDRDSDRGYVRREEYGYGYGGYDEYDRRAYDRRRGQTWNSRDSRDSGRDGGWGRNRRPEWERERERDRDRGRDRSWGRWSSHRSSPSSPRNSWGYEPRRSPSRSSMRSSSSRRPEKRVHWAV